MLTAPNQITPKQPALSKRLDKKHPEVLFYLNYPMDLRFQASTMKPFTSHTPSHAHRALLTFKPPHASKANCSTEPNACLPALTEQPTCIHSSPGFNEHYFQTNKTLLRTPVCGNGTPCSPHGLSSHCQRLTQAQQHTQTPSGRPAAALPAPALHRASFRILLCSWPAEARGPTLCSRSAYGGCPAVLCLPFLAGELGRMVPPRERIQNQPQLPEPGSEGYKCINE